MRAVTTRVLRAVGSLAGARQVHPKGPPMLKSQLTLPFPSVFAIGMRQSIPGPVGFHRSQEVTPPIRICRRSSHVMVCASSAPNQSVGWLERLETIGEEDHDENRRRHRPSKNRAKRDAHWSQDIAHQLSEMSEKQLSHVAPLLNDYVIYEVRISAKINGRNQGRRRQEGLIAKMLRNLPGLELEHLEEVVEEAMEGRTSSAADPLTERTSLAWRQALLDGDKETEQTVMSLAVQTGGDIQHLRALVTSARREAEAARKQAEKEEEAAAGSVASLRPQKKKKTNNKQGKILLRELRTLVEAQDAQSGNIEV